MTTFTELTKQVHLINDLILSNMTTEKDYSEEPLELNRRLLTTRSWFSRISWANKKRFLLTLIEDTNSVWTLSLLLKSIWNCRPKDAVISVSLSRVWSSYDQVPMDHNRTALPLATLKEVMTNDRKWYLSLEPEYQANVLSELLMISGGPIMWEVLQRTEAIYDTYLEHQIRNLQECNIVTEPASEKVKPPEPATTKKDHSTKPSTIAANEFGLFGKPPGQAQKELDAALANWNANVKSIRDRMKLEEFEMIFSDGTKKKVWKVNRPKPEAMETVDLVQLLPSELGKRILMNLPLTQLTDCARVNKYWSYLVDELRSELATRQKINIELEKLKETIKRHDANLGLLNRPEFQVLGTNTPPSISTTDYSKKTKTPTGQFSNRSNAFSFRLASQKKEHRLIQKPIRNLADFNERLEQRGAADENLWKWCENILNDDKQSYGKKKIKETEGLLSLESEKKFPCPLMRHNLDVPLKVSLVKDPIQSAPIKNAVNLPEGDVQHKNHNKNKRYNLWSKDMSGLYPVFKLPSSHCPF